MANEEALDRLLDWVLAKTIENEISNNGCKSVKEVEIFYKKVKSKFWIFPIKKKVTVIKFTVNEALYVMEILADDLRLKDYVEKHLPYNKYEYELEIEYFEE